MPFFPYATSPTFGGNTFIDVGGTATIVYNVQVAGGNPSQPNTGTPEVSHLPLEKVHIDVFVVDGNVMPMK
jgi:hypothetical protein